MFFVRNSFTFKGGEADRLRAKAYEIAAELDATLSQTSGSIQRVANRINEVHAGIQDDPVSFKLPCVSLTVFSA